MPENTRYLLGQINALYMDYHSDDTPEYEKSQYVLRMEEIHEEIVNRANVGLRDSVIQTLMEYREIASDMGKTYVNDTNRGFELVTRLGVLANDLYIMA